MLRPTLVFSVIVAACGGSPPPPVAATSKTEAPAARALSTTGAQPCAASVRVLRRLRKPMRLEARVTRDTPARDRFATKLGEVFDRFRAAADGKLTTAIVEEKGHDEFAPVTAIYGGEEDGLKAVTVGRPEDLELRITQFLRTFIDRVDGATHSVGVLVGHGERRLDAFDIVTQPATGDQASMASIITKYFPGYRFVDVDLARGERDVDSKIEALFVLQPSADLTEKELRRIDAFVMRGKGLVVAASAANVTRQSGMAWAHVGAHRLDVLLAGYGIDLHEDVVLDFGKSFTVPVVAPTGQVTARFPQMPDVSDDALDGRFLPFFHVAQVTLPHASSITIRPAAQPSAKVHVVARTSERATVEKAPEVDVSVTRRWSVPKTFASHAIAAAAEGRLKSAFGAAGEARPGRVLVIASASPFANPFVTNGKSASDIEEALVTPYAQASLVNAILALKNTLDWATDEDDLGACAETRAGVP